MQQTDIATMVSTKTPRKSAKVRIDTGEILGRCDLPEHVITNAAKLAEEFFAAQEALSWSGDDVETYAEPLWLKRGGATWRPDVSHLGMKPTGKETELVVTAGVDQHIDDFHGPVLLVVLHNDRLKFKQGKVTHVPAAGDWFIFNDRVNHGVSTAPGRTTFIGWAIPLQKIQD